MKENITILALIELKTNVSQSGLKALCGITQQVGHASSAQQICLSLPATWAYTSLEHPSTASGV